jgi:hypothetical protein
MSFRTSVVLSALCSLGLGLFLLVLIRFFLPVLSTEGYGILSLDAAYADREIGALLAREGVENFISESTQWVFLDDFDELKKIPLDLYGERVESFDPRNDGYAERIRSFFIREGKRFFFIPLSPGFADWGEGTLTKRIARSLGNIPYSFSILGNSQPVFWFFSLFVIAAAGTLILSGTPLFCAALLPVLAPLLFAGSPGFALSAILMGLAILCRKPVREYFIFRSYQYRHILRGPDRYQAFRDLAGTFRRHGVLLPVFIFVYGAICGIGGIPPVLGLFFFCSFAVVFVLVLRAELSRGETSEHIRFVPVAILDFSHHREFFPGAVFPLGLASLLSLFLFPLVSGFSGPPLQEEHTTFPLVSPLEYENHLRFQFSFSLTPLGNRGEKDYTRYVRDEDGLIAAVPADPGGVSGEEWEGIPSFPLEQLMVFLEGAGTGGEGYTVPRDILPACLVLLVCVPAFFSSGQGNRKKKRILVYQDKRIAA